MINYYKTRAEELHYAFKYASTMECGLDEGVRQILQLTYWYGEQDAQKDHRDRMPSADQVDARVKMLEQNLGKTGCKHARVLQWNTEIPATLWADVRSQERKLYEIWEKQR